MSEDRDDDASSGTPPRTMKPTVIGVPTPSPSDHSSQGKRPTVIGGGTPPLVPTAMPGTKVSAASSGLRPTALPASPPSPQNSSPAKPVSGPTVMMGTARHGIEVSLKDLERRYPGSLPEALERIQRRLKKEVLDLLTEAQCAMWGVETQRKFGELASRSLSLVSSGAVKDAEQHFSRLLSILSGFAAAFDKRPQGFFPKKQDDPKEYYEANERELAQLQELLISALPSVNAVDAQAAELEGKFLELENELMAEACAAQYVAEELLTGSDPRRANALATRSGSLLEALANLKQGASIRDQSSESIRELLYRIQNGVLNALPAWIQNATLAFQQDTRTKTENYTLRQALDDVLQHLKKK